MSAGSDTFAWLASIVFFTRVILVEGLTNTEYFTFPAKTDPIVQTVFGDTVNASWISDYTEGVLMIYCNEVQVDIIYGLPSDAYYAVEILTNWTAPCHMQLGVENATGWFDSGIMDIVDEDRATSTWSFAGSSTACATATSAASTADATQATTTGTTGSATGTSGSGRVSSSAPSSCSSASGGLGVGAGIGIGVAGSAVVGIASFLIWFMLSRRAAARREKERTRWIGPDDRSDVYLRSVPHPEVAAMPYNQQSLPIQEQVKELPGRRDTHYELDGRVRVK